MLIHSILLGVSDNYLIIKSPSFYFFETVKFYRLILILSDFFKSKNQYSDFKPKLFYKLIFL